MSDMSITFEVSKPVTSREVRDLQLLNMYHIVLTLEVLKPETSSAVNAVQPANI